MTATAIYSLGRREFRAIFFFFDKNTYEAKVDEYEMMRRIFPHLDHDARGKNNHLLLKRAMSIYL